MAKKKSLPWGTIYRRGVRATWYWRYYDREKKATLRISTGEREESAALRIAGRWAVEYLAVRDGVIPKEKGSEITIRLLSINIINPCWII